MKINDITKLREQINELLSDFNKTSNIKLHLGKGKFDTSVTFDLIGEKLDENNNLITNESQDFITFANKHHIKSHALNYEFIGNGDTYKIVGYKSRNKKYPILYLINNDLYKCDSEYMIGILKNFAPELLF